MSIRQALRRQAVLASEPRSKRIRGASQKWCSSNAIVALMAAVLVVVCAAEMLRG